MFDPLMSANLLKGWYAELVRAREQEHLARRVVRERKTERRQGRRTARPRWRALRDAVRLRGGDS